MLLCVAAVMAFSVLGAEARASLHIYKSDGSEAAEHEATMTYNPDTEGWDITLHALYAPGYWTRYDIRGDAGETIDNLFIDVPWALGSPVLVSIESDPPHGVTSVHNILQTGTAETILGHVETEQDIGSIEVETIGDLHAGRDIVGPVRSTQNHSSIQGMTDVIADRHILGDIIAEQGRIVLVVAYGAIGSEEHPVTLRARHDIIQIAGYEGVWANINTRANGGAGRMFAFGAPTFVGTLETEKLFSNPFNGMPGRIVVTEQFDARITIGKSFDDPEQWMDLPAHGLGGQIILNADGEPGGAWSSPIRLGTDDDPEQIVLSAPHYEQPASLLGGGSIGLVPFALHDASCAPPNGSVIVMDDPDEPVTVGLRHYGPVTLTGGEPLIVQRREMGSSGVFQDVSLSLFTVAADADDPNSIRIGPARRGPGGFEAGYEYRISATDQLCCAVPASPPVAWLAPYEITIEPPPCPGDLDEDGDVDTADLLHLIACWGTPGGDLDDDATTGTADLLLLLAAWGECPGN
ncbi:MAG: hypothetical protein SYC29_03915 [Planctomycetota bacterium]|nr:hypothetical protein [Planctomycetota bacterium]